MRTVQIGRLVGGEGVPIRHDFRIHDEEKLEASWDVVAALVRLGGGDQLDWSKQPAISRFSSPGEAGVLWRRSISSVLVIGRSEAAAWVRGR